MKDKIIVEKKESYGTTRIYIKSEQKEAIGQLTGRKTITKSDIEALKKLGFELEVEQVTVVL